MCRNSTCGRNPSALPIANASCPTAHTRGNRPALPCQKELRLSKRLRHGGLLCAPAIRCQRFDLQLVQLMPLVPCLEPPLKSKRKYSCRTRRRGSHHALICHDCGLHAVNFADAVTARLRGLQSAVRRIVKLSEVHVLDIPSKHRIIEMNQLPTADVRQKLADRVCKNAWYLRDFDTRQSASFVQFRRQRSRLPFVKPAIVYTHFLGNRFD